MRFEEMLNERDDQMIVQTELVILLMEDSHNHGPLLA